MAETARTESLTESAALERVMRQVLEMQAAGDIDHLIREVWGVLEGLQYDFVSCAFLLIDNERDWMSSYNVWSQQDVASMFSDDDALRHVQRLGEDAGDLPRLVIFTGQTSLDDAPSIYQEAIAAWRTGQVERHVLSPAEIEEMARVNTRRYRAPMTAESYPVGAHLYVPFEHGVFTLRTDRQQVDPFSDVQVSFLKRLVRTVSVGYARYREFLRLELDRTVQHMRAEVQAMKQGDDIIDLMGLLWDELQRVGIDFHYMSIAVSENEHDDVHLYGVWHRQAGLRLRGAAMSRYPIYRADVTTSADLYYKQVPRPLWDEHHTEFSGVHYVSKEDATAYAERTGRLWQAEDVAATDGDPRSLEEFVMMAAHLPQGRIMVAQSQETANAPVASFTPEHVRILEAFAEALGMGFTRFFDFQRLERHNRELEVERSVDQLRAEVASMRQSSDIAGVTVLLGRLVRELGLEYWTCSFNVIDADMAQSHLYAVGPSELIRSMPVATIPPSQLDEIIERLGVVGAPVFVPDVIDGFDFAYVAEDLQGSPALEERDLPPRVVHRNEAEALEELPRYQRRWADTWSLDMLPRSVIRVPFSHGSIAVMHLEADQFAQPDVDLVAAFADAISLGFTRFHDFQRLERHNHELVIRQSVDRLRAEVASMRQSSDIADVAVLLGKQLKDLGLEFSTSSFSVIDEHDGLVRLYGLGPGNWMDLNITLGSHTVVDQSMIGVLADIGGPVFIRNIFPGYHFFFNAETLADSPIYAERDQPPRLLHRTEADAEQQLAYYRRRWTPNYPLDRIPRSVIRVPFSHGTIALVHFDPEKFTQRDVDLVAAYADAISLGFTRFHDFQRLEQRNRELEIERALEQVQIGVQNMKTSGDIMPVITLLSTELRRLGLDYSWCTISIVDKEAEKVRVYGTVGTVPLFVETFLNWTGKGDLPFGPDTIERLENEDGPLFITGIPGASTEFANYMVAPLDSFHGRLQQIEKTTIISRNEEETEAATQEYMRRWNRDDWPEELILRSVLRTPFSGGTIALTDSRTDHFTAREARILERFAEAFTLGYTRHLDFRQLEAQNKALTAASRIKSEFLTNMSHELRTPMNAIINFSSMALDGVCGEISDELRDILGEIDQNGEHLLALINDVLDLSKIEAGAMQLNRAPCDPADCVDTAVAALEHAAADKGLTLKAMAPGDLPPLLADERRLTQHVLINLVKNAIKFTDAGEVECGARAEEGEVLFWVKDTGIGIAPAELERIFETFHQVDTSITRPAEGSGLGLAIARKFVELHRGRIWVASEEGEGSTFYLTIPAVA